jgi:predicted nucleotidyltransferase
LSPNQFYRNPSFVFETHKLIREICKVMKTQHHNPKFDHKPIETKRQGEDRVTLRKTLLYLQSHLLSEKPEKQ